MKYFASFPMTAQHCLANRAINYGDGVFETILVKQGKIPLWNLHKQRLKNSLACLEMDDIDDVRILRKILSNVTDKRNYVCKLVMFRDDFNRGYGSESRSVAYYFTLNTFQQKSVDKRLAVSDIKLSKQQTLAGLKHLNRLEQVVAASRLKRTLFTDAIMLDDQDNVIETISKNIILIKDDKIYTPDLKKCGVHGVALRWLSAQGFQLNRKKIAFKSLSYYHGLMVCNALHGFHEIDLIDDGAGFCVSFKNNSVVMKQIKNQWQKYMTALK